MNGSRLNLISCYSILKSDFRRKIVKQQNQGSVKDNTVLYSKVKGTAHPNEEKDYVNIPSLKGTGTDSECDCEMN